MIDLNFVTLSNSCFALLGFIQSLSMGGVIVLIWYVFLKDYLKRFSERIAEETSEKSLKKFQSQIDKELFQFQTKHQKQLDAIQETYKSLQQLNSIIQNSKKVEKFTQPLGATEKLEYLIEYRHAFKNTYKQNKLIFSEYICKKIEIILPVIDKYIETYESGLLPEPQPEEVQKNDEFNGGSRVSGFYSPNAFKGQLEQLEEISSDIEKEFRIIYGTT